MENAKKYSYFEFLLDKSGIVLKKYLEEERKDPSPWELCKQLIEKSLSIKMTASLSQGATEKELKVYETQRIWQPLCLAMTMMAHLKWDLDLIQQNIPLHIQQILMEELLKGYGISQVPRPEDFDINKYRKRAAMVHILYNRWVVRTITKYEELKEKDILPSNMSISQKELKENQELQILTKIKEYRSLSIDILERSVNLTSDIEVPLPRPRIVTATEIIPTDNKKLIKNEDNETMEVDTDENQMRMDGITMNVPEALDISIPISKTEAVLKICYDLGCYYFPKELFSDASRVFQKAVDLTECGDTAKNIIDYDRLLGYHKACLLMVKEALSNTTELSDLCFRLEESTQNEYKDILTVLKEDNIERNIPYTQRLNIEKELYLLDKKDDLFSVCTLNFIRCSLDGGLISNAYLKSLQSVSKKEVNVFTKYCKETQEILSSDVLKQRLADSIRLAVQFLIIQQKEIVLKDPLMKDILVTSTDIPSKKKKKMTKNKGLMSDDMDDNDSDGGIDDEPPESKQTDMSKDERIGAVIKLKSKLVTCSDPETIKDILFELHELQPEKSHAAGYEFQLYHEIFQEIQDLLMFDTAHVFVTKARQLTLRMRFEEALLLLNTCVDTLNSYAKKASPGCSVARVKNLMYHELLWTELHYAECFPENSKSQETMRRSKACIKVSQQDPPPRPHIYQAIVVHMLNAKEYQFLCDAGGYFDTTVVDYLQLGFHLSSVACGKELGVEVLRNAAKGLWKSVFKIVAENCETPMQQGPPSTPAVSRARGPLEDKHMRDLQCFLKKDELVEIMLKLKDDNILTLLLSCLTSLLSITMKDSSIEMKDSYSHLWPSTLDGSLTTTTVEVLSVLKPLCEYCLRKNSRNISWLRTIGDVYLVEGNYQQAMKCYLEVGSITTAFFSRPVPNSIWDEKIYRNMITCCRKRKCFMQVIVLCQFLEPVDYSVAFKAVQERCSEDGKDVFYDCIWDINILEYLIYAHDKRGEIEMRKLAVRTIGQPELNCRGSAEILQQSRDIRKIRFLRALTKIFWT